MKPRKRIGDAMDPDRTLPPAERYKRAEASFDKFLDALVASPWSLAAFIAWTVAIMAFGFWLG